MNNDEIKNVLIRDYFNYRYCGIVQRIVDVFMSMDNSITDYEDKDFAEYKVFKEKLNIINIANSVLKDFKEEPINIMEIEEVINAIQQHEE